jgi:hypothetical protein
MSKSKHLLQALVLAALPVSALAMSQGEIDVNGDGVLSVDEVQTAMPDVSTDMFLEMDLDGDGLLNAEEVSAAADAGILPMTES